MTKNVKAPASVATEDKAPGSKNKPKPSADVVMTIENAIAEAPVEDAPPPDIGADNMRARIAALNEAEGDPPPIPDFLDRTKGARAEAAS
jgi:hypothetical protein